MGGPRSIKSTFGKKKTEEIRTYQPANHLDS